MSQNIDDKLSEMGILGGEKNNPPHTQQSQMATEFTSSAVSENTLSKFTSSSGIDVAALPIEGVTDSSGPHDEMMNSLRVSCPGNSSGAPGTVSGPPLRNKRKHRRGKPKTKNTKPYKNANWKFHTPRYERTLSGGYPGGGGGVGGGGSSSNSNSGNGRRMKLNRSRSLVPYNTNKFLMEEHLAEVPSALLTPSGRTRDSSFSVDSEDNYFYSLPEDEEEFLTKEFANVYEKARVERLETFTKQQLIQECLQCEDRCSEQGSQRQQELIIQKISAEHLLKVRQLEDKIRDMTRENYDLRRQLAIYSATTTAMSQRPAPMDSSSEDSESDSSSSSSQSSSSSESSLSECSTRDEPKLENGMIVDAPLNAEEEKEVVNGFSKCNGYHSAASNTPSSSPSRPSSPQFPRLPDGTLPETAETESRRTI